MIPKILHQAPQLPPRNTSMRITIPRPHAHGAIPLEHITAAEITPLETGNMLAVVVLAVGIGAFDQAAETRHCGAAVAALAVVAREAFAPAAAAAVDAEGGGVRGEEEEGGEGFDQG